MGFRLTIHIENAPDIIDGNQNKKGIKNTISVRNIPTHKQVELELVKLRDKYTIARGSNGKKMKKYGKELIYVSNEK
mgnify:FL=1|tara:strand:+ start:192 stop:422 length:231 start_codon:yes stop_codon:yes gene_type:complete